MTTDDAALSGRAFPFNAAVAAVRDLHPYQPGKPIGELARELGVTDIVKLASNESPLGPSPHVAEAISALSAELGRYPDGAGFELRQALSEALGVAPAQLTLGNGSNDVLDVAARVFLGPGREAVFSEHAFIVYSLVTQAVGATARVAPADSGYGHDLDAMRRLIGRNTRMVFIANPNNPTGTWLPAERLRAFMDSAPGDVMVVLDQAYVEYVDAPTYPDALDWLPQYPNLIITRSFSKAYGLAGMRVGYGVSHPDVADLLNRVRQPFNVNSLAQVAALTALADGAHLRRAVDLNRVGLRRLARICAAQGFDYIPSIANFIAVAFGDQAAAYAQSLLRQGVIVRPVANHGLPRHLRVSVGTAAELRRFEQALRIAKAEVTAA